ncbi:luciferase domain-containing protein [Halomarina ordinaria]|uniref:Luciferase family protein n=1 Tax=Halomarina ordinaria TaxID=3033939 RepID=A0ABD5U6Y2_9EURY|nr:luciferase family protein [Halomarina sp. PSRA2]
MTTTDSDITTEVGSWPGVTVGPHRFAGTEFSLDGREFGHLHAGWQVDVPFTRRLRDALVAEGAAAEHHLYPESGWVTYYLDSEAGSAGAVRLLRLSYLARVAALRRRADPPGELEGVDVAAELARLDPSDAVRTAFGLDPVEG